jgi:hypothetical protein
MAHGHVGQPPPEPRQGVDAFGGRPGRDASQARRQLHQRARLHHRAGRDGAIDPVARQIADRDGQVQGLSQVTAVHRLRQGAPKVVS